MAGGDKVSTTNLGKAKNIVVAFSVLIAAVAVVLYILGLSAVVVFVVAAVGITGLATGPHFRSKPNIKANRVGYIMLFACWVGLAIFFLLSALFVGTRILQPSVLEVVAFAVTGLVIGGATGDWVGRRRGYRIPDWS
jgi:hypothetical protein